MNLWPILPMAADDVADAGKFTAFPDARSIPKETKARQDDTLQKNKPATQQSAAIFLFF